MTSGQAWQVRVANRNNRRGQLCQSHSEKELDSAGKERRTRAGVPCAATTGRDHSVTFPLAESTGLTGQVHSLRGHGICGGKSTEMRGSFGAEIGGYRRKVLSRGKPSVCSASILGPRPVSACQLTADSTRVANW